MYSKKARHLYFGMTHDACGATAIDGTVCYRNWIAKQKLSIVIFAIVYKVGWTCSMICLRNICMNKHSSQLPFSIELTGDRMSMLFPFLL